MQTRVRRKWRPRLWTVVSLVLSLVLCLPIAGLVVFKFYANQLVQQTEESLLSQATTLAATYAELYDPQTVEPSTFSNFDPVFPTLSLNNGRLLPPRPDGARAELPIEQRYLEIAAPLSRIALTAQQRTLAGYRFVDAKGTVIAGTAERGLSLSGIEEVERALAGEIATVTRVRLRDAPEPAVYALSRGTRVRVFVAAPAVVDEKVIGVVYISRTPNHIFRFLYGERWNLAQAGLFVALSTLLIGWVFWRFITGPIQALIRQTERVGRDNDRWQPLSHFGTREIENLSGSFQSLTGRLQRQQDALRSYTAHVTHELKSPLTAVKGAAELLRDADMTASQRARFLDNIARDITRMEELLDSMRQFSLTEQLVEAGQTHLGGIEMDLRDMFPQTTLSMKGADQPIPLHPRALKIVLNHMIENAVEHHATEVTLRAGTADGIIVLSIADNGKGISAGNLDKVLTPFFTTRRDQGGTGMGLNIAAAIIEACGGELQITQPKRGACFELRFPNQ